MDKKRKHPWKIKPSTTYVTQMNISDDFKIINHWACIRRNECFFFKIHQNWIHQWSNLQLETHISFLRVFETKTSVMIHFQIEKQGKHDYRCVAAKEKLAKWNHWAGNNHPESLRIGRKMRTIDDLYCSFLRPRWAQSKKKWPYQFPSHDMFMIIMPTLIVSSSVTLW